MKNKLAFIMTLSLLLTSISPVNAIGAEIIEAAEEESPSVYFTEDEEDPEFEIVEDPETVPEADMVEVDGADEEIFTEELIASDISDLIEEEDPENGTIFGTYISGPVSVGDAGDGRGRAGYGESVLSAASEPDGSEYYGSQLSETQKAIYELLKGGNWQYCEPNGSDEGHYTMPYPAGTDYSFELDSADFQSSDEYQSICQRLSTDIYSAFDAYLYDYPEESFWIRSSGMGWSISGYQDYSGLYHFSLINIGLNAYERWTGAIGQVAQLKTCTANSVAQIQAVDGYSAMMPGEKLKAVHDHICGLVSYGDASNVVEAQHTPYGAYDSQHKVVCEGYAKLFKILTDKLDIADNALVSGIAKSSNGSGGAHMWNAVSLNGSWYLLDATWDDQDNTSMVYYDYFLAGSGSYGFSSSMTVGEQHEAQAYLSDYGDAFIPPLLSGTMFHQRKQTNATATCTEDGSTTVVCGLHPVMAEGTEAAAETITIPATGHDWHADWTWTGTVRAWVHFHCENNHDHYDSRDAAITSVTTPATCEENGKTVYTATVTFDGTVYTDTKTVTIQKTGHNYDDPSPVWSWADDYSSATVTLTCQNDPAHTKELAGTITSVITSNPTYTEAGEKTHTAVAEYEGRGYQDQKTEEIPKLSPNGVTENGLSWKIAGGVLTISLQEDVQSAAIPDYASFDDAPWTEAAKELNVSKIAVAEGITGIGSNAFTGLENVSEIDLPRSLTELADDSMDGSVLSTINVNYAGTESEWAALTQGTAYEGTPMTSTHTHTWNTGKVTKPATTTAAGIRTYTCTVCGETRTESIPRLKTKPVVTKPVVTEKITITKKPSIKKPTAAKNKITVNWKHFKHTSKKTKPIWNKIKKVQVQCAADSGFKNNVRTTIVGKKKTKATIKGLARKTTYYVRVRYYDGTGYSAWSKAKKVKTK